VLPAAVRRLWRDRETLQLGRPPGAAVVLAGVDEPVRRVLPLLDGTRDRGRLRVDASRAGCPPSRADALVELLDRAGLLEDAARSSPALQALPPVARDRLAPDVASLGLLTGGRPGGALERRRAARVQVLGAGRVGSALAGLLAATGIGAVDVVDAGTVRAGDVGPAGLAADDVGRERGRAVRDRLRALETAEVEPLTAPDLVVLTPSGPVDDAVVADLLRRGVPHLLAEVRGAAGVVGPLVVPGLSSCLHCLDLTRTDHDPGWPWLAAQLSAPTPGTAPCDVVLATAVAASAALQVQALLDEVAAPTTLDGTLELVLPDTRWRRRSWSPHPACSCGAVRAG
jgi:hypothetical protein